MKIGDSVIPRNGSTEWRVASIDGDGTVRAVRGFDVKTDHASHFKVKHRPGSSFKPAITIGTYRMPEFLRMNVMMCRAVYGEDTPILISEDVSQETDAIRLVASDLDCFYMATESRMSHTGGDIQHFVNAAAFAKQMGRPHALKTSVRLISLPGVEDIFDERFRDSRIKCVLPSRPHSSQIARSQAMFYSKFPLLTDMVAWTTESLDPEFIASAYRESVSKARIFVEQFVESFWQGLVGGRFLASHAMDSRLSNHSPGCPKLVLRKATCSRAEYLNLASGLGINGPFDVREWRAIENDQYKCFQDRL